jgi:ornithine cyclodeaminase
VLILNDPDTGYPFACLESSIISASRTAASAALAADRLWRGRHGQRDATAKRGSGRPTRWGVVGAGLIARYVHRYLQCTGWRFDEIGVHDLKPEHARRLAEVLRRTGHSGPVVLHDSVEELVRSSDLILFATVTGEPYVHDPAWFEHAPLVLNVSLRDLSSDVVLAAANVVDDADHCLTANTSVHLAEQRVGHRRFIDGTLHDALRGTLPLPPDRPVVFSPFGLGVLDLALGSFVHARLGEEGALVPVEGFFAELDRYDSIDRAGARA